MNRPHERSQMIARLTPLAQALAWVDRAVAPVAARRMAIAHALGRTLADDVVAPEGRPAVALALRDGWALRAEDTLDAGSYAPAILSRRPTRLDAGDKLPGDADTVASLDAVQAGEALSPVAPGDGVLAAGVDAAPGAPLRRAGERLRTVDIAALQALGVAEVGVRAPRVGLAAAKDDPVIAAIVAFLAGAVAAAGGTPERAASLDAAFAGDGGPDLVIVVGGTGCGRGDESVARLAKAGRVDMHGIALSPGETAALGIVGPAPALLVPGRLDAALAVWLTLGRPIMARLCGHRRDESAIAATLTRKVASPLGLAELVLVRRDSDGQAVTPVAGAYLSLSALAAADGWFLVAADSEGCPAGATIDVKALP